jgi:hypothetical protein
MLPWREASYYLPSGCPGPTASLVWLGVVGVSGYVTLLLVAVGLMRQASERARAAKAAEDAAEKRDLAPGFTILHGKVSTGDAQPAIKVRIEQSGRSFRGKGGMRHVWTEVDRRVEARPFTLVLGTGERVKVIPGKDVLLVDMLSVGPVVPGSAAPSARPTRTRVAALGSNADAYVAGRLVAPVATDPYRAAEEGYTLHPPGRGRMLLSVEPLEARLTRRARLHRTWVFLAAGALLFMNTIVFGGYWTRLLWGVPYAARVTKTRTWNTHTKSGTLVHDAIDARATLEGRSVELEGETNPAYYGAVRDQLARREAVEAPFVIVSWFPASYGIGPVAWVGVGPCVVGSALLSLLVIFYAVHATSRRPWYERRKVVDRGMGEIPRVG